MPSDESFDLSAAGLRADGTDLRISVEVLAAKLESSLPGRTQRAAPRRRPLGRGEKRVRQIQVDARLRRRDDLPADDRRRPRRGLPRAQDRRHRDQARVARPRRLDRGADRRTAAPRRSAAPRRARHSKGWSLRWRAEPRQDAAQARADRNPSRGSKRAASRSRPSGACSGSSGGTAGAAFVHLRPVRQRLRALPPARASNRSRR